MSKSTNVIWRFPTTSAPHAETMQWLLSFFKILNRVMPTFDSKLLANKLIKSF